MSVFSPMLLRAGLRYLLRHRWQGLLALTGIALGVAVVLAVELANSGARAAFELSAQQLQGRATHRLVVAGATLPDEVYVNLQRQSGAPPMAPVVKGRVGVEGLPGRYRLVSRDDELAIDTVSRSARREYETSFDTRAEELEKFCQRYGVHLMPMSTEDDPVAALQTALGRRTH